MKKTVGYLIVVLVLVSVAVVGHLYLSRNASVYTEGVDTNPVETAAQKDEVSESQIAVVSAPVTKQTKAVSGQVGDPMRKRETVDQPKLSELSGKNRQTGRLVLEGVKDETAESYTRIKILETDFKYPLVRVEEEMARDAGTGREFILDRREMVADHVIVKLKSGVSHEEFERINSEHGASIRKKMGAPDSYLVSFASDSIDSLDEIVTAYNSKVSKVAYAEPDYILYADALMPDDSSFHELWGIHNTGQSGGTADADIDAPEAWDVTVGSHDVLVGVIDTGVDRNHPDLAANMWYNPGEAGVLSNNGLDDDENGYIDDWCGWDFINDDNDPMDDHYHGTHCAGTIGGVGNNAVGVAGVCWDVSMVAIKFLGANGGTTSDAIDSVYYATLIGVDLTSNSWGGGGFSQGLKDAIADAGQHDILFVAAAGNNGSDNDVRPHYPSNHDNTNIISVAATDRNDGMAYFSCYGATTVDLGAPGVNVYSTSPGNSYRFLSGTSMATPHVAGACALLMAVAPLTPGHEIKSALMAHVDPTPAMNGRCVSDGRMNLYQTMCAVATATLILQDFELDDGAGGNDDGFINPGESVALAATMRNLGNEPVTGAVLTVTCDDPLIQVTPASINIGDVAASYTETNPYVFNLTVNSGTPTPRGFGVEFVFEDVAGTTWYTTYTNHVYSSCMLSGRVTRSLGTPMADVKISYAGVVSGEVMTDADGYYHATVVSGDYIVQADKEGFGGGEARSVTIANDYTLNFVLGRPELVVNPNVIDLSVVKNGTNTFSFDIENVGDVPMQYSVQHSGYVPLDAGLEYNWIDISSSGTEIVGLGDDRMSQHIDFGFQFPFYESVYSQFRVCGNGFITLGSGYSTAYSNIRLPVTTGGRVPRIAFFWDDLNFTYGGKAYYQLLDGDKMVIQFDDVPYYSARTNKVSCELIVHRSGQLVFQYKSVDRKESCTVGVDAGDYSNGYTMVHNEAYIENEMVLGLANYGAIWLDIGQPEGTLAAGAVTSIHGGIDAEGIMALTTHTACVGVVNVGFEAPKDVELRLDVLGRPGNHPPVAAPLTVVTQEDRVVNFTLPISDADNEPLYVARISDFEHGYLYKFTETSYRYVPDINYHGTDTMYYTVNDLEATTTGSVEIIVESVNDMPYISVRAPAYNARFPTNTPIPVRLVVTDAESNVTSVTATFVGAGTRTATLEDGSVNTYVCEWPSLDEGTYQFYSMAQDGDGGAYTSYVRTVEVVATRIPEFAATNTAMINETEYAYYEGDWTHLPDYELMDPIQEGLCSGLQMDAYPHKPDGFGYRYSGYLYAPSSGVYRFQLSSDDGSKLYIGDALIVNNDGMHGHIARMGTFGLFRGYHKFHVDYFDASGGESISLITTFLNPAGSQQNIYNNLFRHPNDFPRPVAYIKSPAAGTRFIEGETAVIRGEAYDGNGYITHVGVYDDGEWLGNATNYLVRDYIYEWQSLPVGEHDITFRASDNVGNVVTSRTRMIEVYQGMDQLAWTNDNVGSVSRDGWAGRNPVEKLFCIEGAGNDIWGAEDSFHFVYQPMKGDCEIVARVLSVENTHEWAKAGIMVRESMDAESRHATVLVSPVHGVAWNARLETGSDTTNRHQAGLSTPVWLRLVRDDDEVAGYYSLDGSQWTEFCTQEFPELPETVYVGMAVSSHISFQTCKAVFDNVQLSALGAVRVTASASAIFENENACSLIRVSRFGYASTNDLAVNLHFTGSAVHGEDYQTITNRAIIPAGSEYIDLPLIPIADEEVEDDEIAIVSIQVDPPYRLGVPSAARVRIAENPRRAWRLRYFTEHEIDEAVISDEFADPDCDGMNNFHEYAFGYNPRIFELAPESPFRGLAQSGEGSRPVVGMLRRRGDTNIVYAVEGSDNLTSWAVVTDTTETNVQTPSPDSDMEEVHLQLNTSGDWSAKYFRMKVYRADQ